MQIYRKRIFSFILLYRCMLLCHLLYFNQYIRRYMRIKLNFNIFRIESEWRTRTEISVFRLPPSYDLNKRAVLHLRSLFNLHFIAVVVDVLFVWCDKGRMSFLGSSMDSENFRSNSCNFVCSKLNIGWI